MNNITAILKHEKKFYRTGTLYFQKSERLPTARNTYRAGHHPATKRKPRISKMIGEVK